MNLSLGGVTLNRLQEKDLEMLRNWRNDPKIAGVMFYQQHITKTMQEAWFHSLGAADHYFIIETNQEPIGLIHLNVDSKDKGSAFAGLFIYDESYWGTQVPVYSSLLILHYAFEEIGMNQVLAKVRSENKAAIAYNESLGFSKLEGEHQRMNREAFLQKVKPLYQRLKKA